MHFGKAHILRKLGGISARKVEFEIFKYLEKF
jgi:hypothetical protein